MTSIPQPATRTRRRNIRVLAYGFQAPAIRDCWNLRAFNCGEWKATAAEISRDLDLLQVPHKVVTAFRFPLASPYSKAMREGEEVRILCKNLPHLFPWMPSLEQTVADIPEDASRWDFTLFQPRADGMIIAKLALSAEWPSWSKKQARAARLVCAECDYDLRDKDETRAPFDIRLPEQPKRRRLVCGKCCNDGLDEMERLAALAGKPS